MTTLILTRQYLSRRAVYMPLLTVALVLAPLLYALPLAGQGIDDINMVRHFGHDDNNLYRFHGQYDQGPLYDPPFDNMNIYPKAFYNLAGVVLYPYTAINGGDFQVVLVTWRVLNMLAAAGAVLVLFVLARRVFQSDAVALLGALLFAITPVFLTWTSSVRPNPLELLLVFSTLYFCIRLFDGFSYRTFLVAAVLSALTFSTKYGGWLFVGLLPALSIYVIWRSEAIRDNWTDAVKGQVRVFRRVAPLLVMVTAVLGGALAWLLSTHSWDPVEFVLDVSSSAFPPEKLERAPEYLERWRWLLEVGALGALLVCAMVIGVLVALWRFSRKWESAGSARPHVAIYLFLLGWFAVQIVLIYGLVFFATGPVYLANIDYFVSQVGYMVYYSALGGSYGAVGPPSFVESLRTLGGQFHPGWIAFAGLLAYAAYRELRDRRKDDSMRDRRLFLWLYAGIGIAVVVVTRNSSLRHMLPALGILAIIVADVAIPKLTTMAGPMFWRIARSASVPTLVLVALLIGFHLSEAYGDWSFRHSKPQDTGLQMGVWLQTSYPGDTRIMTDWWTFYLPPSFIHTASVTKVEEAERRPDHKRQAVRDAIVDFDPDVIVIAHPQGYEGMVNVLTLLSSDPVLVGRDYRLIKTFEYDHSESQRYEYSQV